MPDVARVTGSTKVQASIDGYRSADAGSNEDRDNMLVTDGGA